MALSGLLGHQAIYERLLTELANRPSHAYLFTGLSGIGKRLVAESLIHSLLCERAPGPNFCCAPASCPVRIGLAGKPAKGAAARPACECCATCVQVASRTHPDLIFISRPPGRTDILIEQVRELIVRLGTRPVRSAMRVVIIDDAETLNISAQNALLKTLEEPPGYAIMFLIAASEGPLLDTVRSRLRAVRFGPIDTPDIARLLIAAKGVDAGQAASLAALGRGSVGVALSLLDRDELPFAQLLEALKNARAIDFPVARGLAEKLFAGRDAAAETFELLARILQDLLARRLLGAESALPSASAANFAALDKTFTTDQILVTLEHAVGAASAISEMANPRLQAEQFWIALGRTARGE